MSKADITGENIELNEGGMNIDFMRSLVKQYSELGQWTSALFWADAAAAAASNGVDAPHGNDIWLLASAMLARGELHRATHAVTSRQLHKQHLLCLGVAMRAYITAREPAAALSLMDEADPMLLEPRSGDHTHNRALAGVLVWGARALSALERREAAAKALSEALRADCACYEALDLLLDQHALTPREERELIESLDFSGQLSGAEGALLRNAYSERLHRYSPPDPTTTSTECPITAEAEQIGSRMSEAAACRGRRLAAACRWKEALAALDDADPWCCVDVRAACLVELKRSSELFAFAHTLVDAYPNAWTSWFAVGCYYYLIGKSEFARRYLSKAKSLEPSAGCVWLAYGHSFAADSEHDQAMAAYFKASQLMAGCHLPPLYVAVECSLLNNVPMCERFLLRAASRHNNNATADEAAAYEEISACAQWERVLALSRSAHVAHEAGAAAFAAGHHAAARDLFLKALSLAQAHSPTWERVLALSRSAHVAHEAGAAAFAAGHHAAARGLFLKALSLAQAHSPTLSPCWAATLDGIGHATRALNGARSAQEALQWHEKALALRPARAASLAAAGLCLALMGRETDAAAALHAALAKEPDDVVSLALLDAIVDRLDAALTEEEIPQFPFPPVNISLAPPEEPAPAPARDLTNVSDMSMSFD